MKYLKLPNRTELHVWTPLLASRGDMVEVIVEDEQPVSAPVEIAPEPEPAVAPVEVVVPEKIEIPTYTLKSAGFGRYNVLDAEGVAVTAALPKAEAQAKLAELNA